MMEGQPLTDEQRECYHWFVDSEGGIGYSVLCVFCGYAKCPDVLDTRSKAILYVARRLTSNADGKFMVGFREYPYVRSEITSWT